jgi:hypothetical protein
MLLLRLFFPTAATNWSAIVTGLKEQLLFGKVMKLLIHIYSN